MKKLILLYSICQCFAFSLPAQNKTEWETIIRRDTFHCQTYKYLYFEETLMEKGWRDNSDLMSGRNFARKFNLYKTTEFFNENGQVWLTQEYGNKKKKDALQDADFSMYSHYNYFSDLQRHADSTYTEILLTNDQLWHTINCYLRKYNKSKILVAETSISTRKYNRLAKAQNRIRKKRLPLGVQDDIRCNKMLDMPLFPFEGFGKYSQSDSHQL